VVHQRFDVVIFGPDRQSQTMGVSKISQAQAIEKHFQNQIDSTCEHKTQRSSQKDHMEKTW